LSKLNQFYRGGLCKDIIKKAKKDYKGKIDLLLQPVKKNHFIKWINLIVSNQICQKFLKPNQFPKAEFCLQASQVSVKKYSFLCGFGQRR